MTPRFEIILDLTATLGTQSQNRVYLDTYQTEPISLNFNIADITDIGSRNSSFSKTIRVPETKNNRKIFGDISDLSASTEFDPNKKTRCWVLVDSVMVFEGFLQLRNVIKDIRRDKTDYECVIYADNDNFFKAMGETYLTDLEWSEANHIWSTDNIVASWTASSDNLPYFYPLIDYGYDFDYLTIGAPAANPGLGIFTTASLVNDSVSPIQMFPATNVKWIVDKIFANAGYTYQSNFLNSSFFKKLYIPYNRKEIESEVDDSEFVFSVGRTSDASIQTYYPPSGAGGIGTPNINNYVAAYPYAGAGGPFFLYTYTPVNFDFGTYRLPFNSETFPNGDPYNLFDTTTYQFIAPNTPSIPGMRFACEFEIVFQFGVDPTFLTSNPTPIFGPNGSPANWIAMRRDRDYLGNLLLTPYYVPINGFIGRVSFNSPNLTNIEFLDPVQVSIYDQTQNPNPPLTTVTRYKKIRGSIVSDALTGGIFNYPVQPNERIWVEVKLGIANGEYREQVNQQFGAGVGWGGAGTGYFVGPNIISPNALQGTAQFPNVPLNTQVGTFSQTIRFFNTIVQQLQLGQEINYNTIIPKNIKNKDFIASIIKLFNLYVEPSKELDRVLIIEPRDDYYSLGDIKDWSDKVDLMTPINEQILGETQNREIRLKYRDDNDYFNEDYLKKENISFGEYRRDLSNEFTSGIKTIEPLFSPTPLVEMKNSTNIIIPKIGKLNNNLFEGTETNLRILTRYEPNQTQNWTFGGLTASPSLTYPNNACITSTGIAPQRTHAFNVGDVITIRQNDNGATYPTLQGSFEVLEVINNRTIIISIAAPTFAGYVAGIAIPLPGVVGSQPWKLRRSYLSFPLSPYTFNYYPYLGHFSHPRRPNYDLNFGQCAGYYHTLETVTGDNLHRLFYQSFLDELTDKDSRVVSMQLYLTPEDIYEFKFSDNIYIGGQFYRVNKISDYDPTRKKLTKVELLKTKSPLRVPLPELNFGGVGGRYEFPGPQRQSERFTIPQSIGVLQTSRENFFGKTDTIVAGRQNTLTTRGSIVAGDGNEIYSNLNLVVGNDNRLDEQSFNNFVLGSRNEVLNGVGGSVVIGNDIIISSSNTFGFSGVIASMPNSVSAGKNEVLSPFNVKPPNYISGSRNSVFEWGTQDPVNYISGNFNYNS